ncbi:MAG: DUF2321 domain-containing protein [Edaphobacter sp.]
MPNALYCANGHYIGIVLPNRFQIGPNDRQILMRGEDSFPQKFQPFCTECGDKNISACHNCRTNIVPDGIRPSYCGGCGKPFPWTERALVAANDYTNEIDGLSNEDKIALKGTFIELTINTPQSAVAATRFKRIVKTIAPAGRDVLTKIIVDVASQAAKAAMGLQ